MKINLQSVPFYLTCFALFIPILNHLIGFEISTFVLVLTLCIALTMLKPQTRYPKYLIGFVFVWLSILTFHLLFKGEIGVFGYMQSFFYGLCFYLMLKNTGFRIAPLSIYKYLSILYKIIMISLLIEILMNILGMDSYLNAFFSEKEGIGLKNYYILPSRLILNITGIEFSSLNSIFFGPQSASILALMLILFYNIYDKSLTPKKTLFFILSIVVLFVGNTMTANLIFIFFMMYFFFFSKTSRLNKIINKLIFLFLGVVFFAAIIDIFFFVFNNDILYEQYRVTWFQPFFDFQKLDFMSLLIGIPKSVSVESVIFSHEFGLLEMTTISGIMPFLFWLFLCSYLVFVFLRIRKYVAKTNIIEMKYYFQFARTGIFVMIIFLLSLFHYLAVFSNGFFQLLGFHLAIIFYCLDQVKTIIADNKVLIDKTVITPVE